MTQKIRVLFLIGSMGGGGAERQVLTFLKHLDRSQFEPLLYLIYRSGEFLGDVPNDVPVSSFWEHHRPPKLNWPGRIHRIQARALAGVIRDQDVDILYARTWEMALLAGSAARISAVPWVAVEVADPRLGLSDPSLRFRWLKRRLVGRVYRSASRVIANSEGVRQGLIDYYRLPERAVITLYNSVDIERLDRLVPVAEPALEPGRFHVVCAGRLHRQKGYIYLLRAVDELVNGRGRKELAVHVLGQGPLEAELKEFVSRRGLAGHVFFPGFTPNPYSWFRQAQLFCLPSLYEGMPNALLEAMACGVPVLAADCPSGPSEILDGGKYGRLVPPGDSAALADAILHAMDHYEEWRAIVPLARARIEQDFSVSVGVKRLEQLLLEVCERE